MHILRVLLKKQPLNVVAQRGKRISHAPCSDRPNIAVISLKNASRYTGKEYDQVSKRRIDSPRPRQRCKTTKPSKGLQKRAAFYFSHVSTFSFNGPDRLDQDQMSRHRSCLTTSKLDPHPEGRNIIISNGFR